MFFVSLRGWRLWSTVRDGAVMEDGVGWGWGVWGGWARVRSWDFKRNPDILQIFIEHLLWTSTVQDVRDTLVREIDKILLS